MIRQMCPNCVQLVELPDDSAGQTVSCPKCQVPFPVAGTYAPAVDPTAGPPITSSKEPTPVTDPRPVSAPTPPPGLVPTAISEVASSVAAGAEGYERSVGFHLSPRVLDWVPAGCLTLALFLTFFSWVGTYPGGTRVYSQTPWQALFADYTVNTLPEDLLKDEADLDKKISSSWLMLPYLPLLIVAVILAWAERLVNKTTLSGLPHSLKFIENLWPMRMGLLAILAAILLVLAVAQTARGLGLETAIRAKVAEQFTEQIAQADTTPKKQRVLVQAGAELNRFGLQGTTARDLAIFAHLLAVVALLTRFWIDRRGTKPPPRFQIQY